MSASTLGSILGQSTAASSLRVPVRAAAVALAVVLTAASAQFTLPMAFTDVPFTLQPMVVLLTAAALGSRLGATAQVLYIAAGVAGLPVFAADPRLPQGALRLLGPTGGYLMAYPLAAFITGWLAERGWDRRYLTSLGAMAAGLVVVYVGGLAWRLGLVGSLDLAIATSVLPFLLPDLFKIAVAAVVLPGAWRLLGRTSG
jgi:biotin transport system substrate-specific component